MIKTVLITGVSGGIGTASASVFAIAGWRVFGVDCIKPSSLTPVECFVEADLADPRSYERLFTEIADKSGNIDALINNAALQICKPLLETTLEEWDMVMAVNLRSVYLSVYHMYPLIQKYGGSIVNVSSVHAVSTSANIAAYAASKGALTSLTRALAIEMAPNRIRVNSVLPGAIDTQMLRTGLKRGHLSGVNVDELMANLAEKTVMGRIGTPEEIAQAIFFLADDERSSFITGQALIVDGGATARLSTE